MVVASVPNPEKKKRAVASFERLGVDEDSRKETSNGIGMMPPQIRESCGSLLVREASRKNAIAFPGVGASSSNDEHNQPMNLHSYLFKARYFVKSKPFLTPLVCCQEANTIPLPRL
jgi:hypothetical protein